MIQSETRVRCIIIQIIIIINNIVTVIVIFFADSICPVLCLFRFSLSLSLRVCLFLFRYILRSVCLPSCIWIYRGEFNCKRVYTFQMIGSNIAFIDLFLWEDVSGGGETKLQSKVIVANGKRITFPSWSVFHKAKGEKSKFLIRKKM